MLASLTHVGGYAVKLHPLTTARPAGRRPRKGLYAQIQGIPSPRSDRQGPGVFLGGDRVALGRLPRRGQPTRVLTAAVSSVSADFASAKNMLVFGSTYSSLSMPA